MKKFILSLFVGFVGIISFCSATEVVGLANITSIPSTSINRNSRTTIVDMGGESIVDGNKIMCISLNPNGTNFYVGFADTVGGDAGGEVLIWKDWNGSYICLNRGTNGYYLKAKANSSSSDTVYGNYFFLDELLETEIPVLTSLECQTQYSLIPISDVNSNYCEINGLCPACPEGTGFGYSSFYVKNGEGNWNELSGTENYFIYIPEYLGFNYDYSNQGRDLDFTVGVGVDTGSLQSVIDINSYRPTSEDFTNVFVSGLTLVMPYIVIALFIIFVRKLLKRIFK